MMLPMTRRRTLALLAAAFTAACQVAQATIPTPDTSATSLARSSWTAVPVVAGVNSPVPTWTLTPTPTLLPTPTATVTVTASATLVPSPTSPPPTAVPTNTRRPTITRAPTIARTTISTAIPGPFGG